MAGATVTRFGLLRGSFVPPKDLRELQIATRYRRKLTGMLTGEKNRSHKLLDDAGIQLGGVVADINGVSASKMVKGLIAGGNPVELAALGRGKVGATTDVLATAPDGDLSARHRLVLEGARRKPYRDPTVDREAAGVAKNAPRWIRAFKKYGYWPQLAAPNPPTAATAS